MSIASFDVIVVGAGPAGLTAATGAARAGLKALCLDKLAPGGALINLAELHEVPSYEGGHADGPQIASQLTDEATEAGVELGFGEVVKLTGSGPWTVETADGEQHTGRAVVIATGLSKGTLGLPEEGEYDGRGLSHCASCDGPLYAGRPVVVAGTEGWAPREAAELQVVAGDVTVIGKPAAQLPDGVHHLDGRIVALEGSRRPAVRRRRDRRRAEDHSGQRGVRLCRPVSRCGISGGNACTRRHRAYRCRRRGPHLGSHGIRRG